MRVQATAHGTVNLSADSNVSIVGDATLATFLAGRTPALATQVTLCHAALRQMITQVSWIVP
jgi:hypothetical protein